MNFKGNPEHLKILQEAIKKNDISIWNEFNNNLLKTGQIFNIRGINLVRTQGANLHGAYLSEAHMEGAVLSEAYLERAYL